MSQEESAAGRSSPFDTTEFFSRNNLASKIHDLASCISRYGMSSEYVFGVAFGQENSSTRIRSIGHNDSIKNIENCIPKEFITHDELRNMSLEVVLPQNVSRDVIIEGAKSVGIRLTREDLREGVHTMDGTESKNELLKIFPKEMPVRSFRIPLNVFLDNRIESEPEQVTQR